MAAARVLAFKHITVFEISYTYSICATKRFNFSFHLGRKDSRAIDLLNGRKIRWAINSR